MVVRGIAASAMVQGEVTHSTAISTPTHSMPNDACQVLRWARHHVMRIGMSETNAMMVDTRTLLTTKNAAIASSIQTTDLILTTVAPTPASLQARLATAAVNAICATLYSHFCQAARRPTRTNLLPLRAASRSRPPRARAQVHPSPAP